MKRVARKFHARVRHPLTKKRVYVSAQTSAQIAAMVAHVDNLRAGLRVGTVTEEEVMRQMGRLGGRRRPMTLEQAARSYMGSDRLAAHTKRRVESLLATHLRELAPLRLLELDPPRLSRWIEQLGRTLSWGSVRVFWNTLRGIMRHALERGLVDTTPWGSWRPKIRGVPNERPRREAARDVGELRALLEAAGQLDVMQGSYWKAIIACAALLGLRQGELVGLRWDDVDMGEQSVRIARQADGPTKGRRVDVLLGVPELFDILREHGRRLALVDLFDPQGPVFPCAWRSSPGDPKPFIGRAEVLPAAALRKCVERAGLPNVERWTPHSLRATFITLEAQGSNGDLRALQERSRHASIGALVTYLRAATREPAPPRMLLSSPTPAALPAGPGDATAPRRRVH